MNQAKCFAASEAEIDVQTVGEGFKRIIHPVAGPIAFEFSSFAVDGRPDLRLVTFNPARPDDAKKLRRLCQEP